MRVLLLILLVWGGVGSANAASKSETVLAFVDAFNQQNIEKMLSLATPDMRWMSVMGAELSIETDSHQKLANAMNDYFKSLPSVHSSLLNIQEGGNFVTTLEKVQWTTKAKVNSQCSVAVYEFADGLINNVWYFDSYSC